MTSTATATEIRLHPGDKLFPSEPGPFGLRPFGQLATITLDGVTVAEGRVTFPAEFDPADSFGFTVEAGPVVGVDWRQDGFRSAQDAAQALADHVAQEHRVNEWHQAHGHAGLAGYAPTAPGAPAITELCS